MRATATGDSLRSPDPGNNTIISKTGSKKLGMLAHKPNKVDLDYLNELFETGKVVPVIDRSYPLSEVPEALRYFGEGHAKGKIVITIFSHTRPTASSSGRDSDLAPTKQPRHD